MEKLLHYIWEQRLYKNRDLHTTTGTPVEILDPGYRNPNAGPDFFNAKVKIGNRVWAGNIEIHRLSTDWLRHGHHKDKAYDSVILHIVEKSDIQLFRTTGEPIAQMELRFSPKFRDEYEFLLKHDTPMPCATRVYEIAPIFIADWISALAIERLQQKAQRILDWLDLYRGSWEEACYVSFARTLGFSINNDTFERLARSLPLLFMQKHADSLFQIEALLFGQSGLLSPDHSNNPYEQALYKEYCFLQHKFGLVPLAEESWKFARMRPANFPHQRIALLAQLIHNGFTLFSQICTAQNEEELHRVFHIRLQGYWNTHYNFGDLSESRPKTLGSTAINIIMINSVAPVLYAYGHLTGNDELTDRAFSILEQVKAEKNRIVSGFAEANLYPRSALESQALIQLHNEYCLRKRCLDCRIGHKLLAKEY